MLPEFSKSQRDEILRRMKKARDDYRAALVARNEASARTFDHEAAHLQTVYFTNLPRMVMGVCPFCSRALYRSFDPHGLDGPWWSNSTAAQEPQACPHFCVLRGAVNYQGLKPLAGKSEVFPGPETPYVVPRILEMEGMLAVIGEIDMTPGYKAYPIAYFAPRRPPSDRLMAPWGHKIHDWKTQFGEDGWRIENSVWDFDLPDWLRRGKIRWWTPVATGEPLLSEGAPEQCPYLQVKGLQQQIVIKGAAMSLRGLPDGSEISPMDVGG